MQIGKDDIVVTYWAVYYISFNETKDSFLKHENFL